MSELVPSHRRSHIANALTAVTVLAAHVVALAVVVVGSLVLHHIIIEYGDPKLFDLLPLRYLVDTVELGAMLAMVSVGTWSLFVVLKS